MRQIEVVAALISREGQVLVQRRPPGKARASLWEFPGGKVEPGEPATQALARECREELGVTLEVGAIVWSTRHTYADVEVSLALYRCGSLTGTPEAREGQELRWVRPLDLTALPFVDADRPVLALLASGEIAL